MYTFIYSNLHSHGYEDVTIHHQRISKNNITLVNFPYIHSDIQSHSPRAPPWPSPSMQQHGREENKKKYTTHTRNTHTHIHTHMININIGYKQHKKDLTKPQSVVRAIDTNCGPISCFVSEVCRDRTWLRISIFHTYQY